MGSAVHAEGIVIMRIVWLGVWSVHGGWHDMRCYRLSLSYLIHTHLNATVVEHHQHVLCLSWQFSLLEMIDARGTSAMTRGMTLWYLVLDTDLEAVEYPRRMLNSNDCLTTSGVFNKRECGGDHSCKVSGFFPLLVLSGAELTVHTEWLGTYHYTKDTTK